jgi:hypothetical protein
LNVEKNFVTVQTAQNATETTKTLIDTYTVPQGVAKLVEVGVAINPNGVTTSGEPVSCILELECDDSSNWGGTQQFQSDVLALLTSGTGLIPSKVHDCNIPVQPGSHIKFSTTFGMALSVTPSVRCFGKFV